MKLNFLLLIIFLIVISCKKMTSYNLNCTDSVKGRKITDLEFHAVCPGNCLAGSVWGTKSYTTDSAICLAAMHSGALATEGGKIKVKIVAGQTNYEGTEQNGIKSSAWGSYDSGFIVSKP